MSVINTLTEGIRARSLANEGEALLGKWEKTGLLEGMDDVGRNNMARLLENQAAQLLKETSTMQAGDVEGFAAVAFPIVRRVFGNLLAQDLVSVQPMSLPSGLIFFLDFTYSGDSGMVDQDRLGARAGDSLYGGGVVANQLTGGVNLGGRNAETSFYALNNGFSSPTGAATLATTVVMSGTYLGQGSGTGVSGTAGTPAGDALRADASLVSGTSTFAIAEVTLTNAISSNADLDDLVALSLSGTTDFNNIARRLTRFSGSSATTAQVVVIDEDGSLPPETLEAHLNASGAVAGAYSFPVKDNFVASDAVGSLSGASPWGLENNTAIPSIDIKVDSVAVTAMTKKLKAQWTPELAQDLNAYHNLDAEVELTSILSEQIALEIDQEILQDLVQNATGATLYWSRNPGKFVDRETGAAIGGTLYPDFTGTVSEWYETLLETINEVSARIHRKTLRGGANFLVCSPEVANLLEFTSGFRAAAAVDDESGSWGVKQVGSISRKMDIYVDPYFLRNVVLVGRRGNSFLESGYVYAPYVPLQVTPTIFGPDDFVPRKGVMTRYAKKMVRPDMYGLVIVSDLVSEN